jgi:hypothetical protein
MVKLFDLIDADRDGLISWVRRGHATHARALARAHTHTHIHPHTHTHTHKRAAAAAVRSPKLMEILDKSHYCLTRTSSRTTWRVRRRFCAGARPRCPPSAPTGPLGMPNLILKPAGHLRRGCPHLRRDCPHLRRDCPHLRRDCPHLRRDFPQLRRDLSTSAPGLASSTLGLTHICAGTRRSFLLVDRIRLEAAFKSHAARELDEPTFIQVRFEFLETIRLATAFGPVRAFFCVFALSGRGERHAFRRHSRASVDVRAPRRMRSGAQTRAGADQRLLRTTRCDIRATQVCKHRQGPARPRELG